MSREMEIGELAEQAGVTRRTIRYYVTLGLLPPGQDRGRKRLFHEGHLQRLQLIRKMKDEFLPLDEIRRRLRDMTAEDLSRQMDAEDLDTIAYSRPRDACEENEPPQFREPMQSAWNPVHARMRLPDDMDEETWRRIKLMPGLELHVGDLHDESARHLLEDILLMAQCIRESKYREPEAET